VRLSFETSMLMVVILLLMQTKISCTVRNVVCYQVPVTYHQI